MSLSSKRHRTPSQSSSTSTSTPESTHPSKASRTTPVRESAPGVAAHPLLCTLPPTCNHRPTPITNTRDLENHYATYHAHVCEESRCGSVFPDARLLELHQTECHDPIAAVRKDKGEKIFACHLASCARLFLTPKARRLHLIQAHGYPKEYFFAVTNKGVGGLLKRWGEGVSLIRGPWKARENKDDGEDGSGDSGEDDEAVDHPNEMDSEHDMHDRGNGPDQLLPEVTNDGEGTEGGNECANEDTLMDGLTKTMGSLNLVPPSIRFGRGGKNGGFASNGRTITNNPTRGGHLRGRGRGRALRGTLQAGRGGIPQSPTVMEVGTPNMQPSVPSGAVVHGRGGLGWAGRGRAGIAHGRGAGWRGPRGRGTLASGMDGPA